MPESMYILDEPPRDNDLDPRRIVAVAKIERHKNGHYATELRSLKDKIGDDYIRMLRRGDIILQPSGTGSIGRDNIVEQYTPVCLYFDFT